MIQYAGVILISIDDAVLLQQRDDKPEITNPGKVAIFGGSTNFGETPIDCAIREIYEEVEIKLDKSNLQKFRTYFSKRDDGQTVESHIFIAKDIDAEKIHLHEGEKVFMLNANQDFSQLNLTKVCRKVLSVYC